ncbi:hypothetical protein VTK56DRAFT_2817 [Thermocarpiscus australiensis]
MSSASQSRSGLTEFYLTTLWEYKPNIITSVIDQLYEMGFKYAEFTYDDEYHWFKVICRENEANEIRQLFRNIAREIEDDAFAEEHANILNSDGSLKPSVDTEWISYDLHGHVSTAVLSPTQKAYCLPKHFSQFSHTEIWDDLEKHNEPFTLWDIVSNNQLAQIGKDTDVTISCNLSGKLVYIGGNNEESIQTTVGKLKVMLAIKKMSASRLRIKHLAYTEGYSDNASGDFKADIRYLANIDPELVSSTLLDRLTVQNLGISYQKLFQEGASIRLCQWDPFKQYWVSLLGPKVDRRPSKKHIMGNRPTISAKKVYELPTTIGNLALDQRTQFKTQVATWIEGVPDEVDSVPSSESDVSSTVPRHPLDDDYPLGRVPEFICSTEIATEDLIVIDEPNEDGHARTPMDPSLSATPAGYKVEANNAGPQSVSAEIPCSPIDDDQIPSLPWDVSEASFAHRAAVPTIESKQQGQNGLEFTGPDCLIDMLDTIETVSSGDTLTSRINWDMPPLIPSSVNGTESTEEDDLHGHSSASDSRPAKEENPTSPPAIPTRTRASADSRDATARVAVPGPAVSVSKGPAWAETQATQPGNIHVEPKSTEQLPAASSFAEEIEGAMTRLLYTGPYRRGKLSLRAEFGRAIFGGMDVSGLAFNDASVPSNGWEKKVLLSRLDAEYGKHDKLHFTRILSTRASDVEDMINTVYTKSNTIGLWDRDPSSVWTVYSFYCTLRAAEKTVKFIVDVKDDGISPNPFSYATRLDLDAQSAHGPVPIYVHAIRRHWDLRIILSHTDTENTEKAFGPFARTLLQSLSVERNKTVAPELKFAVPDIFSAEVNEVRVLTKWHHGSSDTRSVLEITEVEQMELSPLSGGIYADASGRWKAECARPWTQKTVQQKRALAGEVPRWYEAAVVSSEIEALFRQNSSLKLGEKADWNAQELRSRGLLPAVYLPALQMLSGMDHVGRSDSNGLSGAYGHLLIRANDAHPVPGLAPAQAASTNVPASSGSSQQPKRKSPVVIKDAKGNIIDLSAVSNTAASTSSKIQQSKPSPAQATPKNVWSSNISQQRKTKVPVVVKDSDGNVVDLAAARKTPASTSSNIQQSKQSSAVRPSTTPSESSSTWTTVQPRRRPAKNAGPRR